MTTNSEIIRTSIYFTLKLADEIFDKITIKMLPGGIYVEVGYPERKQVGEYVTYEEFENLVAKTQLQDHLEIIVRKLHQKILNDTVNTRAKCLESEVKS